MGKKDTVTKSYMSKPEYFADAFNYYLFDGRQIILPEKLGVLDPTELGIIQNQNSSEIIQKIRDVLKDCIIMEDDENTYLILGIENQSDIHYAMPVKVMLYNALDYANQVKSAADKHKRDKDLRNDEFLSGFAKEDKLRPVITLTIYFGTKDWDGPRSLKDMFQSVDDEVMEYIDDHKLNLIIPKEISDFEKFKTDFGKAMKYISVADNKESFIALSQDEHYKVICEETGYLLNECTNARIEVSSEGGEIDMCKAVEGLLQEGEARALISCVEQLQKNMKLSLEEALRNLGKTIQDYDEAKKHLGM